MNFHELSTRLINEGDVDEIYLMPWIWRGEYWPRKLPNAAINQRIFPNQEEDFRAYVEMLEENGAELSLHWVKWGNWLPGSHIYRQKTRSPFGKLGNGVKSPRLLMKRLLLF